MFDESQIMYAGTQAHKDDARLFVEFSFQARLDSKLSDEAGHNVYKDVEFVTIRIPGDKTTSVHRPVRPSDKQRFPFQYQQFKTKAGEVVVGTPLTLWPFINPARVKELEYFNVRTVEQLAAMPDGNAGQMMGIQALKQQAKDYVAHSKEQAPLIAVQKELAGRDATIETLKAQLASQGAQLDQILANMAKAEAPSKKGK